MSDTPVDQPTLNMREQLAHIDHMLTDIARGKQQIEFAPMLARIEGRKALAALLTGVAAIMGTAAGFVGFLIGRGLH